MELAKYREQRSKTNRLLIVVAIVSVLAAALTMFVFAERSEASGLNSRVVKQYVKPLLGKDDVQAEYTSNIFPATYGREGAARTLVLYDDAPGDAEVLGILAGNLATHFGSATLVPVSQYTAGQLEGYDALIYQGYNYQQQLPSALVADIRAGKKKVLWAGANLEKIAGPAGSAEAADFIQAYGVDPHHFTTNEIDKISGINYNGQQLLRHEKSRRLTVPAITDAGKVQVLGTAACEGGPCKAGENLPWAIRTGNLTYVGDLPFEWQENGSHVLAFADLYYDLLAPDTAPSKKAAVRIEDVSAMSKPDDLRRVADALSARGVPFQVAVIPYHIGTSAEGRYGLALKDRPDVVEALKYMQSKGGELIQHGTSHQYGAMNNPYPGAATAADYEFVRSRCSTEDSKPWTFEECSTESWVQLTGPLPFDAVADHQKRVADGKQAFIDAGLGAPRIFELPHYGATPNAYEAIKNEYEYRYEQTDYFAGLVSGKDKDFYTSLTQILPYSVTDVYGGKVLPENLGNPSIEVLNNHDARPPALLVSHAQRNQVVREATASFFFHPFLDTAILEEIVTGVQGLGYTFVPAVEL